MDPGHPTSVIFSPSVARQAASTARDWNYVDGWLASKVRGRRIPPFERNAETLKALLALATFSELADEEQDSLAAANQVAHADILARQSPAARGTSGLGAGLVARVGECITGDGVTALDSITTSGSHLGLCYPDAEQLALEMTAIQGRLLGIRQMISGAKTLQSYLGKELARLTVLLGDLDSDDLKPPTGLAKKNVELQRNIKALMVKLSDAGERSGSSSHPKHRTVNEISGRELLYQQLVSQRTALTAGVAEFQGLPPNIESARVQLEIRRQELHFLKAQRDAMFESLAETPSPVKGGR